MNIIDCKDPGCGVDSLFTLYIYKDILKNLESVESCDLEEDDLMLDLDLSEETSLHSGE